MFKKLIQQAAESPAAVDAAAIIARAVMFAEIIMKLEYHIKWRQVNN